MQRHRTVPRDYAHRNRRIMAQPFVVTRRQSTAGTLRAFRTPDTMSGFDNPRLRLGARPSRPAVWQAPPIRIWPYTRRTGSQRTNVAGYVTLPVKAGPFGLPQSQVLDCGYDDLLLAGGPSHLRLTTKS